MNLSFKFPPIFVHIHVKLIVIIKRNIIRNKNYLMESIYYKYVQQMLRKAREDFQLVI